MQPVDLTTLQAIQQDLSRQWLPARLETLQQIDLWTLCFYLRTLQSKAWLLISWHPQAARIHLCSAPPKSTESFQFGQPLQRQLKGLALVKMAFLDPWERVLDCQFAPRPGDPILWHLYLEIMGKYSNAALVDREGMIVVCGHGVSERQSSVRPVQPGLSYQLPPPLLDPAPSLEESFESWQSRLSLIPGKLASRILRSYRGLSGHLAEAMLARTGLDPGVNTTELTAENWQQLFQNWQEWLQCLQAGSFVPGWTATGYTVLGWDIQKPADLHSILESYYTDWLNQDTFQRERHRLLQKMKSVLQKLYQRQQQFEQMIAQSNQAEIAKQAADLLMAHLQEWQPGLTKIVLPDFDTSDPVVIALEPEKNAIVNAQAYYKKHRKQKRARDAVLPLLAAANQEIHYLEQVEAALLALEIYRSEVDLQTVLEIREELREQKYLTDPPAPSPPEMIYRRYSTPNGLEILVGRNNRQNDSLTFRVAQDHDWWFHAQEIPGSHVVLRIPPGEVAEEIDLQVAANCAAHFSRARQSDQVPVVYTRPKYVYKPKGSLPGMVIYKQEKVIWAQPNQLLPEITKPIPTILQDPISNPISK